MHHHQAFRFHIDLYSTWIPLLLTVVPWLFVRYVVRNQHSRTLRYQSGAWLLWLAGAAWFASIQLWNIPISSQTESTTIHLMGGAIVAPALCFYTWQAYGWQWPRRAGGRPAALLGFVTVFGLVNELAELVLTGLNLVKVNTSDTAWDLATNTVGALLAFTVLQICGWPRRPG